MMAASKFEMTRSAIRTHAGVLEARKYVLKTAFGISDLAEIPTTFFLAPVKGVAPPRLYG
jgi:hypothetical protein